MYKVIIYTNRGPETYVGPRDYIIKIREDAINRGFGCSGVQAA